MNPDISLDHDLFVCRNTPHTSEILTRSDVPNPGISLGHDTASCNISDIISSELPSYQ
jgi:hypothetical protein